MPVGKSYSHICSVFSCNTLYILANISVVISRAMNSIYRSYASKVNKQYKQ